MKPCSSHGLIYNSFSHFLIDVNTSFSLGPLHIGVSSFFPSFYPGVYGLHGIKHATTLSKLELCRGWNSSLLVGTLPLLELCLIGTLPRLKLCLIGTLPRLELYPAGTLPDWNSTPAGTLPHWNFALAGNLPHKLALLKHNIFTRV